jgi:Fic family protein
MGYRNAMTYILQLAYDPAFTYQDGFIRSLHFMMLQHDLSKNPGKWRPGSIFVRDERTKQIVYEAPPREIVEPLIAELIEKLNEKDRTPQIIRAAMSHLNLVMIHPFSDGNGRMARCLQTLVLAREGILQPEFCSVEEYLGKQQQAYYDVLAEVGQGSWHPERDTRPWIRFMLKAHYVQAHRLLWVNNQLEKLWQAAELLTSAKRLPDRVTQPIVDAMIGVKVRNASYRSFAEISENLASRDLKALVDAKLLVPNGEKRGRYYEASGTLKEIAAREIEKFSPPDPFAPKEVQAVLPGLANEDDGA